MTYGESKLVNWLQIITKDTLHVVPRRVLFGGVIKFEYSEP